TDGGGRVLGSLCVIDTRPRDWTGDELDLLRDLTAACSAELRARIAAADTAEINADRERLGAQARAALRRSEILLGGSETIAAAGTMDEIAAAVGKLVAGDTAPAFVGVGVLTGADDDAVLT